MAMRHWTVQDCRRVSFPDESPFDLLHLPSRQNGRVWVYHGPELVPTENVKQAPKIMAWEMYGVSRAVRPSYHPSG